MIDNYYTLRAIAASLDTRLRGTVIGEPYSQERRVCVFPLRNTAESLVVSCRPDHNTLYLHSRLARARINTTTVLAGVQGRRVESVVVLPSDRVVVVQLDEGTSLHVQCFGVKSNILLLNRDRMIIDAFKNAKILFGGKPEAKFVALVHDLSALRAVLEADPHQEVGKILRNTFPTFGPVLVREVLHRARLHEEAVAADVLAASFSVLQQSILEVIGDLSNPRPRVYFREATDAGVTTSAKSPEEFSIIPLRHLEPRRMRAFVDIHEAIRYIIVRSRVATSIAAESRSLQSVLHNRLTKAERAQRAIREELQSKDRSREYHRMASLVLANLRLITSGARSIELEDAEGCVTIPLDPKLPPSRLAQKLFEKAKKERTARNKLQSRMLEYQATIDLLRNLLRNIQEPMTTEQLRQFKYDHAEQLERVGLGPKAEAQAQLPFRIFTVDGGFEVWAGKNSKNNDLLTMKHAKSNDLWFHARGAGGSHVVLKVGTGRGEPGKLAKEQAAAIAAYYSKMKNAGVVPVAMTERKYVRKSKGAPPGQVIVEREKVIFAEPKLPANNNTE